MSHLVVSIFDEELRAEEVRLDLLEREKTHLEDFEDAVVIRRRASGDIKYYHVSHLTLEGIVTGCFFGSLPGIILLNPLFVLFGMAVGAIAGAVSGSMSHAGVSEEWIEELAGYLKPGTSALCVLVGRYPDRVLEKIAGYGGRLYRSYIVEEDEAGLFAVPDALKAEAGRPARGSV